jgi:hypothetical protein
MLTGFDLTDGFRFQESASEFVREPRDEIVDVLIACLEPKDVWGVIVSVCLVGVGLFTIFSESEHIVLVADLFSD